MAQRNELESMTVQQLKEYAKTNGIRLYTVNRDKIINKILEVEHVRSTHGDAFRN